MIAPKVTGYFPLLPEARELYRACEKFSADQGKQYRSAINLFSAYLDITGQELSGRGASYINAIAKGFYGFLVVEVDCSEASRYSAFNRVERLLAIKQNRSLMTNVSTITKTLYMLEAVEDYKALKKDKDKLREYEGDFVAVRGGPPIFINMIEFRRKFPSVADEVVKAISVYLSRYPRNSAITEKTHIHNVLDLFCRSMRDETHFKLLSEPMHVNRFFEHYSELEHKHAEREGQNIRSFSISWNCRMRVVDEVFVRHGIISRPQYKLPRSIYKLRKDEPRGQVVTNALSAGLTDISLAIKDGDAADLILDKIESDISMVARWCEEARAITMQKFRRRRELARAYRNGLAIDPHEIETRYPALDRLDDYSGLAKRCAAWEAEPFSMSESKLLSIFGKARRASADELGLLTSSTLLPFLYLLVREHPAITPAWLEDFALYNKHGIRSGLRRVGKQWIAVGRKPRKGAGRSMQVIPLNKRSKRLFVEILLLSREARKHLKAVGDHDYRYLLIGGQSGFKSAKRVSLNSQDSTRYINSTLTTVIKRSVEPSISSVEKDYLIKRLSLRELRTSCGVQVFLKTRSLRKAAQALGHEVFNQAQIDRYIPRELSEFMVDRWVRIFIEGMIFEAMKDSAYLHEAVSLADVEHIDEFLRNHQWKPLPAAIVKGYGEGFKAAMEQACSDKIYIPVCAQVCTLLLSIGYLLDELQSDGKAIPKKLSLWHGTATFIAAVKNEAVEAMELSITPSALAVIKESEPSLELVSRLRKEIACA